MEGRSNVTFFEGFFKYTLRYQIGTLNWGEEINRDAGSDKPFCTPSDEAFAILNLLNLRGYWIKKWNPFMANGPNDGPLYTKQKGTSRDAQGWSQEGIRKFNELMDQVKQDRLDNPNFDRNYRVKLQQEMVNKRKRKRAINSNKDITEPEIDDGLLDAFAATAGEI